MKLTRRTQGHGVKEESTSVRPPTVAGISPPSLSAAPRARLSSSVLAPLCLPDALAGPERASQRCRGQSDGQDTGSGGEGLRSLRPQLRPL